MCDAVDVRFGFEHTHYRPLEEKSAQKDDQEGFEELKAAKKRPAQTVTLCDIERNRFLESGFTHRVFLRCFFAQAGRQAASLCDPKLSVDGPAALLPHLLCYSPACLGSAFCEGGA